MIAVALRRKSIVTDRTDKYTPPAIERRENVTGLLHRSKGSYCPPKTTHS